MITAPRYSAFFSSVTYGQECFRDVGSSYGPMIDNDALILILVDDRCLSAGEFAVKQLQTLDNSVVIGSQTGGCTFCCGTFIHLSLPNSGVKYSMGNTMFWLDDYENRDDIGIEPDIRSDPGTSLEAVLMMLVRNGYADVDTVWGMAQGLKIYNIKICRFVLAFRGRAAFLRHFIGAICHSTPRETPFIRSSKQLPIKRLSER